MSIAYGDSSIAPIGKKLNKDEASVTNTSAGDIASSHPIIDVHISARDLPKLDMGSPSDPMCVLSIPINGKYVEVSRTEVIWNNNNPDFVKILRAMYIFETHQPLRFSFYDCDSEGAPLKDHDYIGYVDTDVQTLVSNMSIEIRMDIKNPSRKGNLGTAVIVAEQASNCGTTLEGFISCSKVKKMRTFSKNCPYVQISKVSESGKPIPVFRSEVHFKAYSCTFNRIKIPIQVFCNGDYDAPFEIAIVDNHISKPDVLIGKFVTNLRSMLETRTATLLDQADKAVGSLLFDDLSIVHNPTFVDYIRSGVQLNLITSIDFTASNRNYTDPRSLHYIQSGTFNQYESCINSVGSIICPYDTDQLFYVYGFGAQVNGTMSSCFNLTFTDAPVQGLEGILGAYRHALGNISLSGPTLLQPTISMATRAAEAAWNQSKTYTILLVLTDGIINDLKLTKEAIVSASESPLSIIIVGVGSADFSSMKELDGDGEVLVGPSGRKAARDIVQFVEYSKYTGSNDMMLAGEVLSEIPKQLDEFCRRRGYFPQF